MDALEKAAENRDELVMMGKKGRELAIQRYDRNLLADQWVDWVTGVHN